MPFQYQVKVLSITRIFLRMNSQVMDLVVGVMYETNTPYHIPYIICFAQLGQTTFIGGNISRGSVNAVSCKTINWGSTENQN